MRGHEVLAFARVLRCPVQRIGVVDLLTESASHNHLDETDVVLLGGSGDYSVAEGGPWLPAALGVMREIHRRGVPTFASCWGFQAMARAMGGSVVHDLQRAEVGTHPLELTDAGRADPVFGPLGSPFLAQMGHEDLVETLPDGAVLLASSPRTTNQAFRFAGKPIYCTQFHPELDRAGLLDRLRNYPKYVRRIAGVPYTQFETTVQESPAADDILRRFVEQVVRRGSDA